jgi:hypothetical protein
MKRTSQSNYGTYATAIGLATIGATVSLSGLVALFGLTFLPIGVGLEVAKLVAARRLRQGDLTGGLRATLIALIAICMAVTTVGIYGFISRCYTDRIATMTRSSDHDLAEASERVKVTEQSVASIDQQIARLDAPETKTVKVKVAGRTTETTVPVAKDKAGRAALEARRAKAATELADLRVQLASRQAERAHVENEINTIRAIASAVGLSDDVGRAVRILAGILAVMWDPFAVLLLLTVRRVERPKPARKTVAKRKTTAKPKSANVIRYPQPA